MTSPLCAWFPHFIRGTLDLVSNFLHPKLPLPQLWTHPFVVGCCLPALIWAFPTGGPSFCLIPTTPAVPTSLGSPVSIRGLPPHSTGTCIMDHSTWLAVYKMRDWPCVSFFFFYLISAICPHLIHTYQLLVRSPSAIIFTHPWAHKPLFQVVCCLF